MPPASPGPRAFSPHLGLIQKYGLLDFSKIVVERGLDRLTGGAVSRFFFDRAMRSGHVYFGEHLGARQGVLGRHFFMFRLACQEIARADPHPYQVLEVGSYAGGSAITWALAIKSRPDRPGTVTCVDPWTNYLTEADINASATPEVLRAMALALADGKIFRLFEHNIASAQVGDVIQQVHGRFVEAAKTLPRGAYDLVFVDADHHYQAVVEDLQRGAACVRPGGILCGDDLEAQWPAVDQKFCESHSSHDLVVEPRTNQFVHPGVSRAVWEFFGVPVSAWNGFWAMRKMADNAWQPVVLEATFRRSELPAHLKWWRTKTRSVFARPARVHLPVDTG